QAMQISTRCSEGENSRGGVAERAQFSRLLPWICHEIDQRIITKYNIPSSRTLPTTRPATKPVMGSRTRRHRRNFLFTFSMIVVAVFAGFWLLQASQPLRAERRNVSDGLSPKRSRYSPANRPSSRKPQRIATSVTLPAPAHVDSRVCLASV